MGQKDALPRVAETVPAAARLKGQPVVQEIGGVLRISSGLPAKSRVFRHGRKILVIGPPGIVPKGHFQIPLVDAPVRDAGLEPVPVAELPRNIAANGVLAGFRVDGRLVLGIAVAFEVVVPRGLGLNQRRRRGDPTPAEAGEVAPGVPSREVTVVFAKHVEETSHHPASAPVCGQSELLVPGEVIGELPLHVLVAEGESARNV